MVIPGRVDAIEVFTVQREFRSWYLVREVFQDGDGRVDALDQMMAASLRGIVSMQLLSV